MILRPSVMALFLARIAALRRVGSLTLIADFLPKAAD